MEINVKQKLLTEFNVNLSYHIYTDIVSYRCIYSKMKAHK